MSAKNENSHSEEPVKILLVDDHPENLLALSAILDRPDYHLVTATSGLEALKCVLRDDFAVILLDVMMPEMDGYEVASHIKQRESNRHTPIIFLTAVAKDINHIFRGYKAGAVDYLSKPLASEVVKAKVDVFVNLYRQSKEIRRQAELIAEKEKEFQLEKLKKSEEKRFRDLSNSIPQIVWISDQKGDIFYFNEKWFKYSGLLLEESVKMGWVKAIHPEDRDVVLDFWNQAMSKKRAFEMEFRFLRAKDKQYRWHLSRAIPSKNSEGHLREWFGTFTDIENQKKSEVELQETLRSRDEFFSIASHELKTPITSMKLQIQLLHKNVRKNPSAMIPVTLVRERLDVASRQTDRLERLVENLLDVSRIRSHRLGIERDFFDLAVLVRDVSLRFQEPARIAGSSMNVVVEGPVEGQFDRVRIEQVMTNLISNAIKYGMGKPIEIHLTADPKMAFLTVRDEGIGISKEDQVRIFERFERAVSSRDFSGLGLGLYITQQIVQAHGGSIEVQSEYGKGSIFKIRLPRENIARLPVIYKKKTG